MDTIIFEGLAFLYTTLIVCGTMFVPGYIVNSKIALLKELFLANKDTALIKVNKIRKINELPPTDKQLLPRETLWKV